MKTNLMKSILHLKDDTEYQIPLRETEEDNRAKVGADVETTVPNPEAEAKKETEAEAKKETEAEVETDEISQEEVTDEKEVNNEDDPALDNLKEENPNQESTNTGESNSGTTTESAPQVDTAKAALDEMKKLASQEGVIHPSLFISNFSKILGLMERAMQLQVEESGSVTKESDSAKKEKAPETTTEEKTTEQTETPAEG